MATPTRILILSALLVSQALLVLAAHEPLMLDVRSIQGSDGSSFVAVPRQGRVSAFQFDTSVSHVLLAKGCNKGFANFSFYSKESIFTHEFSANVPCKSGHQSHVGLGAGKWSLPRQLWQSTKKLRRTFSYCLVSSGIGDLSFGRNTYAVFAGHDVLNRRLANMVRFPLTLPRRGHGPYQVQLTGVGIGSSVQKLQATMVAVGTVPRHTSLPQPAYGILRRGVKLAASARKVRKEAAKPGDELDLCFRMSASAMKHFPNCTMEFSGKARWTVSPVNYMVQKSNAVFCFAVKPASGSTPSIGSLLQENNWVEYDLHKKTFGVSGSLVDQFGYGCDATTGS